MAADCLECENFRRVRLNARTKVSSRIYEGLPPRRRLLLCEGLDRPICMYCSLAVNPDIYILPSNCRFGNDCMRCPNMLVSTVSHKTPLPYWLYNTLDPATRADISFGGDSVHILFCDKRQKTPNVYRTPQHCPSFSGM